MGGVYLLHMFKLQWLHLSRPLPAPKQECPDSVLLHGGCCCLWYFVYNVNLYVSVPSHTPPLALVFFCPLCLSVSASFCVWNLHNVVWPSRLIIHVLLMSPVSFVLSKICLFCSFLGFMFPPAYPKSLLVLTSSLFCRNPGSKDGFSTEMFLFDPSPGRQLSWWCSTWECLQSNHHLSHQPI